MENEVIIMVMGVTGAGKSSLVKLITQNEEVVVGHDMKSQTSETKGYPFHHKGIQYTIVDTPGFNDTTRSDTEVLDEILSWFKKTQEAGQMLSAVIFLHKISETRVQGTTMTQIQVLEQLCGPEFYKNLVLGVTFWETVPPKVRESREQKLFTSSNFFRDMKDGGARTVRILDKREHCLALIEEVAKNNRSMMKIQEEFSKGKDFSETGAAKVVADANGMLSAWLFYRIQTEKLLAYALSLLRLWSEHTRGWAIIVYAKAIGKLSILSKMATKYRSERLRGRKITREQNREFEEKSKVYRRDLALWKVRNFQSLGVTRTARRIEMKKERDRRRLKEYNERYSDYQRKLLKWQSGKEELVEDYDRKQSRNSMTQTSGFLSQSCDQPNCSQTFNGIWRQRYQECSSCSITWCGNCNKYRTLVHTTSCRGYKPYGGLSQEEILEKVGYRSKEPEEPLQWRLPSSSGSFDIESWGIACYESIENKAYEMYVYLALYSNEAARRVGGFFVDDPILATAGVGGLLVAWIINYLMM